MSLALSPVLIRRRALGFLEDCKKKVDRGAVGSGGGGIEFVLGVELLCVTIPRVQASSLMLLALYCAHAGSDWFAEGERCFQPSLCLAEKVPLPLPLVSLACRHGSAPEQQGMAQGSLGRILPHLWPSSSRVSFFHFPAKFNNSSAGAVSRREHARAVGSCLQLQSQMYLVFLFYKKNLTTLRQQGELRWRLCKTCIPGLGKAVG